MNIRPAALLFSVVVILVGGIYFYSSTPNNGVSVNTELPVPVEDKITETVAEEKPAVTESNTDSSSVALPKTSPAPTEVKQPASPAKIVQEIAVPSNTDEPPLKLKGIGVNFEDFKFTKEKLQFDRLFMGFGFVIPGSSSSSGQDKSNPQPTYVV